MKSSLWAPARTWATVRNPVALLNEVESLGIRHAFMGLEPLRSLREVGRVHQRLKTPFRLRALTSDPGRRDSFAIRGEQDLETPLVLWMDEVLERSPEAILLPTRPIEGMRRVTLPFARFSGGATRFFSTLENSLDLRGEVVFETLAYPWLDDVTLASLREQAFRIADRAHLVGLGAMEFWVDGPRTFFVRAIAGLTPGHDLWEKAAGTSAAEWARRIADGGTSEPDLIPEGSKPEENWRESCPLRAYVRAEDPFRGIPHPGPIQSIEAPAGSTATWTPGNSEIGTVTVTAQTWAGALEKMTQALAQLWIRGSIQTNEAYLAQAVEHPWVREGLFHAAFLDEEFVPEPLPPLEACRAALREVVQRVPARRYWKCGERVFARQEIDFTKPVLPAIRTEWMGMLGEKHRIRVGPWYVDAVPALGPESVPSRASYPLLAPSSGVVHALLFQEGAQVEPHAPVAVVKSVGRLIGMSLRYPMVLERWLVKSGDPVEEGRPLATVVLGGSPRGP